jgi:uncharacterized membrane protein YdbT with pleckstrin-like domain
VSRLANKPMATFVESVVAPDEYLYLISRLSNWSLFWLYFLGLVLLPLFGLGLILWGIAYVRFTSTELAVTDKRIILKRGWIGRDVTEISLSRVESTFVHQTPSGRVLDYGDIRVAGTGQTELTLRGVSNPLEFRNAVAHAMGN